MIQILAILSVLLIGVGLTMAVVFLIGTTKPIGPASPTKLWLRRFWAGPGRTAAQRRAHRSLLVFAVVAGAAAWLFTGWPVGGVVVMLAIPGVPWLFAAAGAEKKAIARLGALETWTRRVSDYVRNGIGLQAAIIATARTAPPLLNIEVKTLAARLQAGTDAPTALRMFAEDLDDHSSDEVIAPLILQAADAGDGLYAALTDIAQSLSDEVVARSTVDSERASARFTVRFLTGVTVAVLVFGAFSAGYAAPYRTSMGQAILVGLTALYIGLMLWIRGLSLPPRLPRLLRTDAEKAPAVPS
ncbi:type II secretion system F family protein [Catellatospora tritici]|uniref:type II secretion system F family protein n=1 Tax=Catellatospora tritici TaxID=2851566 RepID=UPI001C2D5BC1|nr:type II secretion system F family protein [Catellatospora tritici]MBV1851738.1 type II secretion system F family protein [Catellatospora tritici]